MASFVVSLASFARLTEASSRSIFSSSFKSFASDVFPCNYLRPTQGKRKLVPSITVTTDSQASTADFGGKITADILYELILYFL